MSNVQHANEFAIIGLGRYGHSLALKLTGLGHTVLGIDINFDLVQSIADEIDQAIAMDATREAALKAADIAAFETVIVAIGEDFEANLLITAALKSMGVKQIISKTNSNRQAEILRLIGADRIVQPEQEGGERLALELSAPTMLERVPIGSHHSIAEIVLPKRFASQSIAQCDFRQSYGLTILIIRREDTLIVSPSPDTILQRRDLLVVLGENESIAEISTFS